MIGGWLGIDKDSPNKHDRGFKFVNLPFNKVLFNPIRLCIAEQLYGESWIPFQDLKRLFNLTDGNLASHMRALEKHHLIDFKKEFEGRRPKTYFILTKKGEEELMKIKDWFFQTFMEGSSK